jgi:hypothetical protein|tara:strand:- start:1029 stop:1199 length:171 start_codon:yes stop_codon:yes gene_type:complete
MIKDGHKSKDDKKKGGQSFEMNDLSQQQDNLTRQEKLGQFSITPQQFDRFKNLTAE